MTTKLLMLAAICAIKLHAGSEIEPAEPSDKSKNYFDYMVGELSTLRGEHDKAYEAFGRFFSRGGTEEGKLGYLRLLFQDKEFEKITEQKNDFGEDLEAQLIFLQAYFYTEKNKEAETLINALLKKYPNNEQVVYFATIFLTKQNKLQEAHALLEKLLKDSEHRPKLFFFYFLKSKIELQLNRPKDALASIEKSLKIQPKFEKGWLFKSLLDEQLGRVEEAILGYRNFLDLVGPDALVEHQLINLLFTQQRYGEAKQELKKLGKDTADYYFDMALLEWKSGNSKEALENLEKALVKYPGMDQAKLLKVEILVGTKNTVNLLKFMKEWIASSQNNLLPIKTLVILKKSGISTSQILNLLLEVGKKNNYDKNIVATISDLYIEQGEYKQALPFCQRMLDFATDELLKSKIHYQIGYIYYNLNREMRVEKALSDAISTKNVYPPAYNLLAYFYAQDNQQLGKALDLVNKALVSSPNNPAFLDTKGLVLIKLNRKKEAKTVLDAAQKLAPKDKVIQEHLKLAN